MMDLTSLLVGLGTPEVPQLPNNLSTSPTGGSANPFFATLLEQFFTESPKIPIDSPQVVDSASIPSTTVPKEDASENANAALQQLASLFLQQNVTPSQNPVNLPEPVNEGVSIQIRSSSLSIEQTIDRPVGPDTFRSLAVQQLSISIQSSNAVNAETGSKNPVEASPRNRLEGFENFFSQVSSDSLGKNGSADISDVLNPSKFKETSGLETNRIQDFLLRPSEQSSSVTVSEFEASFRFRQTVSTSVNVQQKNDSANLVKTNSVPGEYHSPLLDPGVKEVLEAKGSAIRTPDVNRESTIPTLLNLLGLNTQQFANPFAAAGTNNGSESIAAATESASTSLSLELKSRITEELNLYTSLSTNSRSATDINSSSGSFEQILQSTNRNTTSELPRFAELQDNLVAYAQQAERSGKSEFTMRLDPPDVGTVHVRMTHTSERGLEINFQVPEHARTQVEGHVESLREKLEEMGLKTGEFSVFSGSAQDSRQENPNPFEELLDLSKNRKSNSRGVATATLSSTSNRGLLDVTA